MEHFEITKDLLKGKNIKTYIPITVKKVMAKLIAAKCVVKLREVAESEANEQAVEQLMAFPSVVGEDCEIKELLLMNTFLSHYLDIKLPKIDEKTYDKYAGSHIFNQFERFKQDKEVQTIAFDILMDFKKFKEMVNAEIYNLKAKQNDPIERILAGLALAGAEAITDNPDILKNIVEQIQNFANGLKVNKKVNETPQVESESENENE